jgi:hypothetical protein
MQRNSTVAVQLAVSQEGLSSMQLVVQLLLRVGVTIDGVWIRELMYCPITGRNCK